MRSNGVAVAAWGIGGRRSRWLLLGLCLFLIGGCGPAASGSPELVEEAGPPANEDLSPGDLEAGNETVDGGDGRLDDTDADPTPGCAGDFCAAGPDHAPDPSQWGPYPVGVTTFEVDLLDNEGNPRKIRVEAWYPTTEEYRDGPFSPIDFGQDAPDHLKPIVSRYPEALPPMQVQVTRDSPMRLSDGPYPLIIFSHGAYGIRFQSIFYTIPLASHGYVVASPDHTGAMLYDILEDDGYNMDDLLLSALDRPLDVTAVLDRMLARNESAGDLFDGALDPERVGASGHSFGGYTAIRMGFEDPRIKAVVPHEPVTTPLALLGFNYASFPVPLMMMAGALDKTLDTEAEMHTPYLAMPAPKFYFELLTGGHFTYSDICILDLVFIANDIGIPDADNALGDGCADYNIPVAKAHPLINQFAIGFFNYYLRSSPDSFKYFDEEAASKWKDDLLYEMVLP